MASNIHIDPEYAAEVARSGTAIVVRGASVFSPEPEILVTVEDDDQDLREKLAAIQILVIRARHHKVSHIPVRLLEMVLETK